LGIDGTQSERIVGLVAGRTASAVRAEALEEWPTQVNAPGVAVGGGKPGEVEKGKKVPQVNVSDRGTCAQEDCSNNAHHAQPAANRSTKVAKHTSQERNPTEPIRHMELSFIDSFQ
jgi:hypothetical protein